jgi:hypothetical protein
MANNNHSDVPSNHASARGWVPAAAQAGLETGDDAIERSKQIPGSGGKHHFDLTPKTWT